MNFIINITISKLIIYEKHWKNFFVVKIKVKKHTFKKK
jgi:hypothetical protein